MRRGLKWEWFIRGCIRVNSSTFTHVIRPRPDPALYWLSYGRRGEERTGDRAVMQVLCSLLINQSHTSGHLTINDKVCPFGSENVFWCLLKCVLCCCVVVLLFSVFSLHFVCLFSWYFWSPCDAAVVAVVLCRLPHTKGQISNTLREIKPLHVGVEVAKKTPQFLFPVYFFPCVSHGTESFS